MPGRKRKHKQISQKVPRTRQQSEAEIQQSYAPRLRQAAVEHLRHADTPLAKGFRDEYPNTLRRGYEAYLKRQARDRVWGTYIEAMALAERYGYHLVVTSQMRGRDQSIFCLYRHENNDAPVIHLINNDNVHWSCAGKSTLGDGNCLYNAFAQAITDNPTDAVKQCFQDTLHQDNKNSIKARKTNFGASQKFFPTPQHKRALILQQDLYESYAKKDKKAMNPSEIEAIQIQEIKRLSALSEQERKQISEDYKTALNLATEQMNEDKPSLPRMRIR